MFKMKKARLLASLSVLLLAVQVMYSQDDPVVKKIIELGRNDNQTMQHLDILSNRIGGRPIGSDAYDNAVEWTASMFRKWGLEVWVQECGELPVGFNRGPWFGKMLGGNGMSLHFATPSYSVGTKGVQRGHVLMEPRTQAEFNKMKGALKGAWVLIGGDSNGYPIEWNGESDSHRKEVIERNNAVKKQNDEIAAYNKSMRNKYGRDEGEKRAKPFLPYEYEPGMFYRQMVEAGILGIIQAADVPIRALYDKQNLHKMAFDNLPPVPDIKLDRDQYEVIEDMVKKREYFLLEFDICNHFKMGPVKCHSVIGVIRGTEFPDEYVMAGGHLDSYDVATGGVDCGNGVSAVMEAARLVSQAGGKPKRSILFCLWAGEEFGFVGSKYFVNNKVVPMEKISNYINRDSGPLVPTGVTVPEAMYKDFSSVCAPLENAHPDFKFKVRKRKQPEVPPSVAVGSDYVYFKMNGVPAIGFNLSDPKGYNFLYSEVWHTERDTYDKAIAEYQEHAATCTAVVLYGLANLDHLLSREGLYKK